MIADSTIWSNIVDKIQAYYDKHGRMPSRINIDITAAQMKDLAAYAVEQGNKKPLDKWKTLFGVPVVWRQKKDIQLPQIGLQSCRSSPGFPYVTFI